jgi:signal transduction histidine kinase/ligand-binding sensor domain-containing protein
VSRSKRGALLGTTLVVALMAHTRLVALGSEKRLTQFVHTAWTPRDGAPSDIRQIEQTPDGYLWLLSGRDVYRFDGLRFTLWSPPAAWSARLADHVRGNLLVTRDGAIWMSIGPGLARVDEGQFAWTPLPIERHRTIDSLVEEDEHGLLLVVHQDGVYRFDRATGRVRRLADADGIGPESIGTGTPFRLWADRDRTIWLVVASRWKGATSVLQGENMPPARYETESGVLYKRKGDTAFRATDVKLGTVGSFAHAPDGSIWVAETTRAVRMFRDADGRFLPPSPEVYVGAAALAVDRHGSLWIPSLGDGLRRVADPARVGAVAIGQWGKAAETYTEEHGLSGDVLFTAFEDREGNVWIGGANGIDRFRDVRLVEFTAKEGVRLNVMPGFAVIAPGRGAGVTVASGTLQGQIFHLDHSGRLTGGALYMERMNDAPKDCIGPPGDRSNVVEVIYRAPDGILWAAGHRLFKQIGDAWTCIQFPLPERTLEVSAMTAARGGGLWLGSAQGELWRYRLDGSVSRVSRSGATRRQRVAVILEAEDGSVWIGGSAGLARIVNGEVHAIQDQPGLPRGVTRAAFTGSGVDLWVLGLNGLAIVRDERVSVPDGLTRVPLTGCWSAVGDGTAVWFNCRHGLVKIETRELDALARSPDHVPEYLLLEAADDLRSSPMPGVTSGSIARSDDGRIWFLTQKGLGYVHPQYQDRPHVIPHVAITAARTGDRTMDAGSFATLEPLASELRIAFTGISLSHPERLRFRYRLDGVDRDWRETGERAVSYNNLSAGTYRMRVMAADYLGVWSDREATWSFAIAPRWYERWWFRLSMIIAGAFVIWLAVKAGFARQAARLRREFAVQLDERARIAGELHDTLLQGFQGAALQLHSLAASVGIGRASGSAERTRLDAVLQELHVVLDDGRRAIWAIRDSTTPGACDLRTAFTRVADQLDASRVTFHVSEDGRPRELNPVSRDILFRLGREALNNAFRHANARRIELQLHWEPRLLRMIVRDDGVGMDEDISRRGREGHFGLVGMRERAERLGATFVLRSTRGAGTDISVAVPAHRIYLRPLRPWFRRVSVSSRM